MHIFKNVSASLWRHKPSKESVTLVVRRDLISSKTKNKHCPRQYNREEVGPSPYLKEGDVPWILKKDYISLAKEVIMSVRVPYLYGSSVQCCFTMYDCLSGLKSHDYLNLLRESMSKTRFYYFFLFLCNGIFYN